MANRKMTLPQKLFGQNPIISFLWGVLLVTALTAIIMGRWELGFVALATFGLATAPAILASRLDIALPMPFLAATTLFIFASFFMGEAFDFYEKVWWWDLALHGASAVGFGLIGFLFVFMLFEGDRYAAPPAAMAFIAFCVAITMGSLWEVFEYLMDLSFDLNMQKTGLDDTMEDIIVNALGGAIGAFSGFIYLKGSHNGVTTGMISQFIALNRRLYRKSKERLRKGGNDQG
ncbi:hypothetical protein [Yoonia sp.]|uniref:hypothetical protein n=1 Tax=Yoonia sp. TaxID=2212373 RepID=UPI003F6B53C1